MPYHNELFQSLKGIRVNFGYLLVIHIPLDFQVSIPERDSGKFRVRAPGTLVICGFQGAFAVIDLKIAFQLLGCQEGGEKISL